jgi:hypothetical protein
VRPPDSDHERLTPRRVSLEDRIRELVGPRTLRPFPILMARGIRW